MICIVDLKITPDGDLEITPAGDIVPTESIAQAVLIRLKWFFAEWRLGPALGFPYFEEVFVKNPNRTKICFLLRDLVLRTEGVTSVTKTDIILDSHSRKAKIVIAFTAGNELVEIEKEVAICA